VANERVQPHNASTRLSGHGAASTIVCAITFDERQIS
jgi:hypothetical protein